jgi:hypothetical protein
MLAAHLTEENHVEVLARARHRSKRDMELLIAEVAPRPDVASRVVALPQPAPLTAAGEGVGLEVRAPERAPPQAVVAPLSPRRYEIRVTVDQETHDKLRQLQDLLAHSGVRDPADIIARGIDLLHAKTLARKAAIVEKPRAAKRPERRTRDIPAAVERAVWTRDGGQCAFVDRKGRRCSATAFLEFHHVRNWARGAEHDESEIELRCRAHNQHQAMLDYGAEFIEARRSRASRAREPQRARAGYEPAQAQPAGLLQVESFGMQESPQGLELDEQVRQHSPPEPSEAVHGIMSPQVALYWPSAGGAQTMAVAGIGM